MRRQSVVVIGSTPISHKICKEAYGSKRFDLIGRIGDDIFDSGAVRNFTDIDSVICEKKPDIIVNCIHGKNNLKLNDYKGSVLHGRDFYEMANKKSFLEDLKLDLSEPLEWTDNKSKFGRRLLSVVVSIITLLMIFPLLLLISVLVKSTSRGPLFFKQKRVGYKDRIFTIYKFRTMTVAKKGDGDVWNRNSSQRITSVGKFLRASHLDELPQIFNVLKGDMNLVGPRPEMAENVDTMKEQIPNYNLRHLVRPGITGWAQVKYRYAVSKRDVVEKLRYDLYYVRNACVWFDVKILFMTFGVVYTELKNINNIIAYCDQKLSLDPTSELPLIKKQKPVKEINIDVVWNGIEYAGYKGVKIN